MQLTPRQRLALIKHLNALVTSQVEELVYALNVPKGVLPSSSAAQGDRSATLLDWVTSPTGCGMAPFLDLLGDITPLPALLDNGSSNVDAPRMVPKTAPTQSPAITTGLGSQQPWRLKSRLGERSPPTWTRYIKASGNPHSRSDAFGIRRVLSAELRFQPPSEQALSVNQPHNTALKYKLIQ